MTTQSSTTEVQRKGWEFDKISYGKGTDEAADFLAREFYPTIKVHEVMEKYPVFARLYLMWLRNIGCTLYGLWRPMLIMPGKFGKVDSSMLRKRELIGLMAIGCYEEGVSEKTGFFRSIAEMLFSLDLGKTLKEKAPSLSIEENTAINDFFAYSCRHPDYHFLSLNAQYAGVGGPLSRNYMLHCAVADKSRWAEDIKIYLIDKALEWALEKNTERLKDDLFYEWPTARLVYYHDRCGTSSLTQDDRIMLDQDGWFRFAPPITLPGTIRTYYATDL